MSKRILVVEDQPDNRQIIRDMLAPTDLRQWPHVCNHESSRAAQVGCQVFPIRNLICDQAAVEALAAVLKSGWRAFPRHSRGNKGTDVLAASGLVSGADRNSRFRPV
jgi:CheY-like chemotaxis protein